MFQWLKRWFTIQEVPEDIRYCEFDCRKPNCTEGERLTCPRRLNLEELEAQSQRESKDITGK
jgi:hypothetical protein